MKRRTAVVTTFFAATPGASALLLTGCGGGSETSSAPNPQGPANPSVKMLFGLRPPTATQLATRTTGTVTATPTTVALPSSVDWSSSSCLPPVAQQSKGDCVSFAAAYAVTTFSHCRTNGLQASDAENQASPADLDAKLRVAYSSGCESGAWLQDGFDILRDQGVTSAALSPESEACTLPSQLKKFSISGSQFVQPKSPLLIQNMKQHLAAGSLLAFSTPIFNDILTGTAPGSGVYRPNSSLAIVGYHAMTVVGYDDGRGAWLVMNSWGRGFGSNGFVWWDYQSFQRDTMEVIGVLQTSVSPAPTPAPAPTPPPSPAPTPVPSMLLSGGRTYRDPVRQIAVVHIDITFSSQVLVQDVEFVLRDANFSYGRQQISQYVTLWPVDLTMQSPSFNPSTFPSGIYTVKITLVLPDGRVLNYAGDTFVSF